MLITWVWVYIHSMFLRECVFIIYNVFMTTFLICLPMSTVVLLVVTNMKQRRGQFSHIDSAIISPALCQTCSLEERLNRFGGHKQGAKSPPRSTPVVAVWQCKRSGNDSPGMEETKNWWNHRKNAFSVGKPEVSGLVISGFENKNH